MADRDFERGDAEADMHLGMAGNMAKNFIHSPLTPLMMVACLAIGILGVFITSRQEDPQISVPMVDIFYQFPGASAEQVASLATDPLERMVSEIPGVEHVYSASQRGQGMVTVQFYVGEKMEPSLVKLYDKLESNKDKIPPGVMPPLVKPKGVDDVPTVTLTLWSDSVDDAALRLIGLEVVQRLKEVPNTSQNFIVGGRSEELRIEVQPQLLSGYGIGIGQVAGVIQAANQKRNVGQVESGGSRFAVYTGQFLRNKDDVERLLVGVYKGAPIYIRDIATVTEGPSEASSIVQYYTGPGADFEPPCGIFCSIKRGVLGHTAEPKSPQAYGAQAITIAIAKKTGTNGVTVSKAILDKVEFLKGRVIPDNVNVSVTRDYGKTANDKVNHLLFNMLEATLLVTVMIWMFLGIRPTFVVATVIPIIILLTVFSAWALNFTIDRVSLFALIFCIGILVDDAVVVIENIYRRWLDKGAVDTPTTVDAVREVGNPTVLATLTIIAALLPMGFVSGMMGPYMRPIPVLGSVAMALSLFAAFIFTPWLAIRIRPSLKRLHAMQEVEHRQSHFIEQFFRRALGPLLDNRSLATAFRLSIWAVFMVSCSMFYFQGVAVKMLPLDNKPEFNIVVNMDDGTALPVTANVIQQLTDALLHEKAKDGNSAFPEITAIQAYTGTASPFNFNGLVRHYYLRQNPWEGDIQVQLLDKGLRDRSSHQIAEAARLLLTPLATNLKAKIQVVEMPPGPPVLQSMVAEVHGPDDATRKAAAWKITEAFDRAPTVVDVDNYIPTPHNTLVFVVDRRKAEHNGISVGEITDQLSMIMGGYQLGDIKQGAELEPRFIVLQAPLAVRSQTSRLGDTPIMSKAGKIIPLAELGDFVEQPQDTAIYHKDLRPVEYVIGETSGVETGLAAPIYGMLEVQKLLHDYVPPGNKEGMWPHYFGAPADDFQASYEWTGEWTVTYETFRDMGLAFMAALILIYMLVVWEFGNFRLPGIIMAPIPLTLIGIIPGHWLLDAEFTATSMIGWIALAGIIVRNSILLVDFSKHEVERGVPLREAVIQSVRTRTRPILITALALVAGSFSILHDPIFQGMAISLMFGAIVSTVLTLFVIPLACVRAPGAYQLPAEGVGAVCAPASVAAVPAEAHAGKGIKTSAPAAAGAGMLGKAMGVARPLVAGIGTVLSIANQAMGRPFNNLLAIPYLLWLALGDLLRLVLAMLANRGQPGGAPSGGQPGGGGKREEGAPRSAEEVAQSAAPESVRPGKFVKSAPIDVAEAEVAEPVAAAEAEGERKAVAAGEGGDAPVAEPEAAAERNQVAGEAEPAAEASAAQAQAEAPTEAAEVVATAASPAGEVSQLAELAAAKLNGSGAKAEQPAGVRDDLKEINGIGPKIERILNQHGISTFAQLADLDVESLLGVDSIVDLAGRVAREDWRGQARKLMKQQADG
jgi:multidrug efflux pump subunit AcrB/predicted flap endonuclease-1-like 5' DNA nuclease